MRSRATASAASPPAWTGTSRSRSAWTSSPRPSRAAHRAGPPPVERRHRSTRERAPCRSARFGVPTPTMGYRIGIDVGGTFTDLVLAAPDGRLVLDKHPTTPHDQSVGVLGGLTQLAAREGVTREALLVGSDLV